MIQINMPVDPDLHKAACRIAVKCRNIIQTCLRDEEISQCDLEFYQVAIEVMQELAAFKGAKR